MEMVLHAVSCKRNKPFTIVPLGDIQWTGERRDVACSILEERIETGLEHDAYFLGMGDYIDYACVDLETRILTQEGWKTHDQVQVGEHVAAWTDGKIVWTPLLNVHRYESAPLVHMKSKSFSAKVTPNHRWVVRRPLKEQVEFRETRELDGSAFNVILTGQGEDGDSPVTADEAWLLGWLVTDGHIRWHTTDNFSIVQAKPQYVEELRKRLSGMIRHEGEHRGVHYFDLHVAATRAIFWRAGVEYETLDGLATLPLRLSHEAREAMLDAMLKAEGSFVQTDETRQGNWRFSQSVKLNQPVCEAFIALATMEGIRLGISKPKTSGVWTPRLLRREEASTYDMTFEDLGQAPVWCPETAYGTWIMRCGEQVTVTGNSPSNRAALRGTKLYDNARAVHDRAATALVDELYDKFLKKTKGRWLGLLEGHHFAELQTGITTDQYLCHKLDAPHLGSCAYVGLHFTVGTGQSGTVNIWCHHGQGNGQSTGAPITKLEKILPDFEADMYLIGHMTKQASAPVNRVYPVWGRQHDAFHKLKHVTKVLVGTGGYGKGYIEGSRQGSTPRGTYVEQGMMRPAVLGSPIIRVVPGMVDKIVGGERTAWFQAKISVELGG